METVRKGRSWNHKVVITWFQTKFLSDFKLVDSFSRCSKEPHGKYTGGERMPSSPNHSWIRMSKVTLCKLLWRNKHFSTRCWGADSGEYLVFYLCDAGSPWPLLVVYKLYIWKIYGQKKSKVNLIRSLNALSRIAESVGQGGQDGTVYGIIHGYISNLASVPAQRFATARDTGYKVC